MGTQFCKYCGAQIDADSVFCPACGQSLASNGDQPTEILYGAQQDYDKSTQYVNGYQDYQYAPNTDPYEGTQSYDHNYRGEFEQQPPAKPKKKFPRKHLIITIVSIVLVAAIVVGTIIIIKRNNPYNRIISALENTIECGSFDFEIVATDGGRTEFSGSGTVVLDLEDKDYSIYMQEKSSSERIYEALLENGYLYEMKTEYGDIEYADRDRLEDVDFIFDFYEENGGLDSDLDFDLVYDAMRELEVYNDFTDIFDKDKFEDAFGTALKENLPELDKESVSNGTKYSVTLDPAEYLYDLLETFEDSFEDRALYDELKNETDYLDREVKEVTGEIVIDDGYIISIYGEVVWSDGDTSDIEIELSNHGKASISESKKDVLKNAYEIYGYEESYDW